MFNKAKIDYLTYRFDELNRQGEDCCKEVHSLRERTTKIEVLLEDGHESYYDLAASHGRAVRKVKGIRSKIADLEKDNAKLKAIIAELCDYVYEDRKEIK